MLNKKLFQHSWIMKGFTVIILFFKYFLPIIAISVLVNVICFRSELELFFILLWKSILTTIITVLAILYGVKREKSRKTTSKFRLFWFFFLPMIPYLELIAIALYEHNLLLFGKKTIVYLIAYGILALYYIYSTEIRNLSRSIWTETHKVRVSQIRKKRKKSKRRGWIKPLFLFIKIEKTYTN